MGYFPCHSNYCTHVLPTVFEQSLSYEEQLCKLIYAMQELETIVNNIQDLNKEYIDEKFSETNDYTDTQIASLRNEFTVQFNEKISEVYVYIDKMDGEIKADLKSEVYRLEEAIRSASWGKIEIYDPTKGYYQNVSVVINNIYDILRVFSLTCRQFEDLQLTCALFDAKELMARDFDVYGYKILYKNPAHYMSSPVTGNYVTLQDAIQEVFAVKRTNGIEAGAYDLLEWTAQSFDEKKMTCYDFDWNFLGLWFGGNLWTEENMTIGENVSSHLFSNNMFTTSMPINTPANSYQQGIVIDTSELIGHVLRVNISLTSCSARSVLYVNGILKTSSDVVHSVFSQRIESDITEIYLSVPEAASYARVSTAGSVIISNN